MSRDSSIKNINKILDHREIGKRYNLFSFHEEAPGFPFFLEKGLIIKNVLKEFWRKVHVENGYSEIEGPILLDRKLWEQSGHWDLFKENMFQSKIDNRDFAIKPMSCPGAILIFQSKKRSFKELPLRLCELGHVHRNENSGSLHGLLRVRSFIQDDAHIFCQKEYLKDEVIKILDICKIILSKCGLENYKFEVALRDPKKDKYLGENEHWEFAQSCLEDALIQLGYQFERKKGEAKFYGPSIDLHIEDSHGRFWQCSSIQLDFNLGQRFNIKFYDANGNKLVPYILHRAIYGSLERFIGILLENYGMDLPFWLAPEQVRVLSLKSSCRPYGKEIYNKLLSLGFRVQNDISEENLSKKIKKSQQEKVPYVVVIGEKEMKNNKVSLRKASGEIFNNIAFDEAILLLV